MRSINRSAECYLAVSVLCATQDVTSLNFYQIVRTVTCLPETLILIKHDDTLHTSKAAVYLFLLLPNQSIWNTNLQGQSYEPKHNPNYFALLNLTPNNLILPT
jgi:hypothetical protein